MVFGIDNVVSILLRLKQPYRGLPMLTENGHHQVERRSGIDRRAKRFGDLRWFLKTGRRRQVRRQCDQLKLHTLDYYPPKLFYLLVAVLLLSIVDALLTLWLVDNGAVEINPVMVYYLDLGPAAFMAIKYFITAAGVTLAVLLNYAFVRFLGVRFGSLLNVFAGCFLMVVVWELFLIIRLVQ
jgi:hypothetical protein